MCLTTGKLQVIKIAAAKILKTTVGLINGGYCIMRYFEMINVSREPQNRNLLYVNEDLRIALTLLRAQKNHYAIASNIEK